MAEVAGLVLGVLPLCLQALKGFRWISTKVRVYQRYSSELSRLQNKLIVQIELFSDKCEFLLADIVDEDTASAMLADFENEEWRSHNLEPCLREHLGLRYKPYKAIVEDISKIITDLKTSFERLTLFEDTEEEQVSSANTF